MNSRHFQDLYALRRTDPVIVCNIHADLAVAIGSRVTRILLSSDTLEKQKVRHPDLAEADYLTLRAALLYGEWWRDTPNSAVILYVDRHLMGCCVRAAVKTAGCGKKIFAVSFCRLSDSKHVRERRKRRELLREHARI